MDKLLSGRLWLTLIVGVILLKACWSSPEQVKEFKEIFLVVIYAYFSRNDRKPENGGKNESNHLNPSNPV